MDTKVTKARAQGPRLLSAWAMQHRYARLPLQSTGGDRPPRDLFTYGPLVVDVAERWRVEDSASFFEWANEAVGLEWICSLAPEWNTSMVEEKSWLFLGEEAIPPSTHDTRVPLSRLDSFLRNEYGLLPGHAHNWNSLGGEADPVPPPVPTALIEEFATARGWVIASFLDPLTPYVDVLSGAATQGSVVPQTDLEHLFDEIDRAGVRFSPETMKNRLGVTLGIGLVAGRLSDRLLLELFDLFTRRPTVRRCEACDRIFVPRTSSNTHCRRYTWDARTNRLGTECVPEDEALKHRDALARRSYRTEYKRLSEAISRARRGDDEGKALQLERERNSLRDAANLSPGRPATPGKNQPITPPPHGGHDG